MGLSAFAGKSLRKAKQVLWVTHTHTRTHTSDASSPLLVSLSLSLGRVAPTAHATGPSHRASLDTSASGEGRRSSRALVCCHANTPCFIYFVFPCQSLPPPIACHRKSSFHVSPTAPSCTGDEMRIGGSAEERRSGSRARLRLPCPCLFVWTDLSRSPMTTAQTRLSLWQRCATRR